MLLDLLKLILLIAALVLVFWLYHLWSGKAGPNSSPVPVKPERSYDVGERTAQAMFRYGEVAKQRRQCYDGAWSELFSHLSNQRRALNAAVLFLEEIFMDERIDVGLRDGTLVRHKTIGYEGKVEGTTAIKACFTKRGVLQGVAPTKESFQYRVAVDGMSLRYIAPSDDLEIIQVATEIKCVRCSRSFYTKPTVTGKARGRCACGAWICPVCMGCQPEKFESSNLKPCASQRKRFLKKAGNESKSPFQRR